MFFFVSAFCKYCIDLSLRKIFSADAKPYVKMGTIKYSP